jgi:hypothetical protein
MLGECSHDLLSVVIALCNFAPPHSICHGDECDSNERCLEGYPGAGDSSGHPLTAPEEPGHPLDDCHSA